MINVVNLADKFALIKEQWDPKIIAQLNDYHIKIAKIQGEFVWHSHPDTGASAWLAFNTDLAVVILHDLFHDRESEAGAMFLPAGHERFENV